MMYIDKLNFFLRHIMQLNTCKGEEGEHEAVEQEGAGSSRLWMRERRRNMKQ